MQDLSFCDRLVSLSVVSSGFIHVVAGVRIPFLFKAESDSTVWMDHILFLHPSVDGHLDCFRILAIVLWTWVCKYLINTLLLILLGVCPEVELLDQMVVLCLIF